ncbi:MAG: hypothetical protein EBZ19_01565 [Proteobacteria bacterium]|nr:hypothetical protein [Pseudomonadota bacterium]
MNNKPIFSKGLYEWVMFLISFYIRIKSSLKIDFESFIILQVIVSHTLYKFNKEQIRTFTELDYKFEKLIRDKYEDALKLNYSSISNLLDLPRETIRRKCHLLEKKKLIKIDDNKGLIPGIEYQKIFSTFAGDTTLDVSKFLRKLKKSGLLDLALKFEKKDLR